MSILSLLFVGAHAMGVQQRAIQTTGHNLANVSTPGFSRQRVELSPALPMRDGQWLLGRGVQIDGIHRVVSRFLEAELLSLNGALGFSEAENRALREIENIFPLTGESGIGAALDAFFAALSDVANNPAGQVERTNVVGKAQALAYTLRQTRSMLTAVQRNLDQELERAVLRLNELLPQIAVLNRQIAAHEAGGGQANDFRDQRQVLLQEVSRLAGATVVEEASGQVTVFTGGLVLVSGDRAASFSNSSLTSSGLDLVTYQSPAGVSFDATALLTQGEIGGLLTMRDVTVANILGKLDQLAKSLVDTVNAQHALGFDLNGAAGGDFFTPIAAVDGAAGLMEVSSAIVGDVSLIAAAQDAAAVPGDNRNALALVHLRTTAVAALGNLTFAEYFLSLAGEVGVQTQSSNSALDLQQTLLVQTQVRREALSGVNVEEEMTNLIRFQRAFEAAAVLVRTGDELYQTILEMVS